MQILIAILIAAVILAFMSSRRAGMAALGALVLVLVALGAWTVYDERQKAELDDLIPTTDVEITETRTRFGSTEYLVKNHNSRWRLAEFSSERVATLPDGTIVDRKQFTHPVDIPPGQARWTPLRFPGLDPTLDYAWNITGTRATEP
ncbi:MAG: hypothetical protein P8080_03260 [Gammaproteobacteria bacterium]